MEYKFVNYAEGSNGQALVVLEKNGKLYVKTYEEYKSL